MSASLPPSAGTGAARIVRVATAQFETGKDKDRVLSEILDLIDAAARGGAALAHFQECCNYPTSYDDREHAWREAITIPGPMFDAISERARRHGIHVSFNAAVRGAFPDAYMVNHLIGPDGAYIGGNKKQILMWLEREAFCPSDEENQVFDTAIGRIGLISCMDGLIPETSRTLACQGAEIILNSLCSNGVDEAHFHIPARSAENGIFMVYANRIGDMVKGADLEQLMAAAGMDRETVSGAGESGVTGPEGEIIARAGRKEFGLTFADLDLDRVQRHRRLEGRRPECYGLITKPNASLAALTEDRAPAGTIKITTIVPDVQFCPAAVNKVVAMIDAAEPGLAVLPELFAWKPGTLQASDPLQGEIDLAIAQLMDVAARRGTYIVAGIPEIEGRRLINRAILIGPEGVIGSYRQVHADPALGWGTGGDSFPVFDLPFGRVAMLLGEDLFYPEAGRMVARQGVDLVACPATWRSNWQRELMLPERSAENHITIAAAGRADSPFPAPAIIVTTPPTYRFPETMEVNNPDAHRADQPAGSFTVEIDLAPNRDKRLMGSTDLIMDTQPALYGRLVASGAEQEAA